MEYYLIDRLTKEPVYFIEMDGKYFGLSCKEGEGPTYGSLSEIKEANRYFGTTEIKKK